MAKSKSVFNRSVWESIWLSQDKKCAQCGKEVELKDTGKRAYSFEVICKDCYLKPQISFVIYDEFTAPNNACTGQLAGAGNADGESTPSANCQ